ncbi:DUF1540 domain-containing protein [Paenibacillus doosanensis]|uniref:DUF1540 domain-containing protein n=1 Tax=Paenibacillus konkukensis TaxID=2020716 RepID=A0ABY4RXY1_9BACL|nr:MULTISPECIES: DUF1540 domain-containing protein [Paenibacillus]MCS7463447.1 DUF1540 domain-containing protein [Paenibacillus doosanensis]UQZ87017.1 hypothetical protein SK3146_06310 [Paenibacillus konkukensis]
MPDVKCSVSNCTFWAEGNNCAANSIMIEVDEHAHADFSSEFAEDFQGHQDKAADVRSTCCHTFKPKK